MYKNEISSTGQPFPTLNDIKATQQRLRGKINVTPTWQWKRDNDLMTHAFGGEVFLKLELFQKTGTFKPRGALNVMLQLNANELKKGVIAVSGGNHAIAVAYAAQVLGTSAKVVMPETANPARKQLAHFYGAEVILAADVHKAFEVAKQIEQDEGRFFVHPFEGPLVAQGTGTVGLELCEQVPELDAVVVPVGGGGLCAGIATAVKLLHPECKVFAVEPMGANTLQRSFVSGRPERIEKLNTIADSLGAPYAAPYSFELCRKYVDDVVTVEDSELINAMKILFSEMKLAVEPAGAASTAGFLGPLKSRLHGKRVALIVCGSNIDAATYSKLIQS